VPIVSGSLSAWLFHERFSALKLLGAALVLAGLMIIRTPSKARGISADPAAQQPDGS
jgi:drug/metabolite transporter (DMT)-like permease